MKRRDFFKTAGTAALFWGGRNLNVNPLTEKAVTLDNGYPFPYDETHFEAGERVVYTSPLRLHLNVLPKQGKILDIRILFSGGSPDGSMTRNGTRTFYGIEDNLDMTFIPDPALLFFRYRIEYKNSTDSRWLSTPERKVRSFSSFAEEENFTAVIIGDDHTPDDADAENSILVDDRLRELRLNGDYVNMFMKKILADPEYRPNSDEEEWKLVNGYTLASTILHILQNEKPNLIIHCGDHRGGFGHKWPGLGLKNQYEASDSDIAAYMKIFRMGTRKIFSALTPEVPVYWALGNHDGEAGYHHFQPWAAHYRKKYFKLPGIETGNSPDENYYSLVWGHPPDNTSSDGEKRGVKLVFCDTQRYNISQPRTPEDWTLGEEQKRWLEKTLDQETAYTFIFLHHVLGGWPSGTNETLRSFAYGRGPLFDGNDYKNLVRYPENIEQVALTRLFKEKDVDAVCYGHDHIYNVKILGKSRSGKTVYGVCAGSPKYIGEKKWYNGDYWKLFYGDCGEYGGNSFNADFWGPAGYTRLSVSKSGARMDYIRSAYNHPNTNLPHDLETGDTVDSFIL